MKNIILLLSIILFSSCNSQEKISLRQMNDKLLRDKNSFTYQDSTTIKILKEGYKVFRLLGARASDINPDKKYSYIYIEDGFQDEEGFYNGIFIIDNKNIFEVTTSPYKLRNDSLSYTKVNEKNGIDFYTKKISIEDFRNNYVDEYFRYQLVIQNKVDDLKKCLITDGYVPKPSIYARNYYFSNGKIHSYGIIRIKYSEIKDGINGEIPYLKKDKEKAFLECINSLNIK